MKDAGSPFSGLGTNVEVPILVTTMPSLSVTERPGSVCLHLGGLARGEGPTLQEAADDLIRRLLGLVMAIRSSGFRACSELPPDLEAMNFLYELSEIAASGEDIRARVFG
jgi:hypothetical protein